MKRLVRLLQGDVWVDPAEVIAITPNPSHPAGCVIHLSNGASIGIVDVTVRTAVAELALARPTEAWSGDPRPIDQFGDPID